MVRILRGFIRVLIMYCDIHNMKTWQYITNLHWMLFHAGSLYFSAFLVPDKLSSSDSTYGQSYIVGADGSQIPRNGTFFSFFA